MTKAEEIQVLRDAAKTLGPTSYCGPWLNSVIAEVEKEVRCDFLPSPSISQTALECETMLETARRQAEGIALQAEEKAKRADAALRAKWAVDLGYVKRHLKETADNITMIAARF